MKFRSLAMAQFVLIGIAFVVVGCSSRPQQHSGKTKPRATPTEQLSAAIQAKKSLSDQQLKALADTMADSSVSEVMSKLSLESFSISESDLAGDSLSVEKKNDVVAEVIAACNILKPLAFYCHDHAAQDPRYRTVLSDLREFLGHPDRVVTYQKLSNLIEKLAAE